ncbi:hypothetical protein ERJ75_001161600 [Trypanosoma vivax]|nr:hypothetical protein TRVL_10193 [Trypanosoma vivax]KAH8609812.1 hypothetical protein ERJ75_001161600 [Trypanosoma vivax]
MFVSEFLKEFKRAKKESTNATVGLIEVDVQDEKNLASSSLLSGSGNIACNPSAKEEHDGFSERSDSESGSGSESAEMIFPRPSSALKRSRCESVWRREQPTGPRQALAGIKTFDTNETVKEIGTLTASRCRTVIPSSFCAAKRRVPSFSVEALREELVEKKKNMSRPKEIENISESCSGDVSSSLAPACGDAENVLLLVDELLAADDLPHSHWANKEINSVKDEMTIDVIGTTVKNESVEISPSAGICASEERPEVAPQRKKMSMFERAKLHASGGASATSAQNVEELRTRKFSV